MKGEALYCAGEIGSRSFVCSNVFEISRCTFLQLSQLLLCQAAAAAHKIDHSHLYDRVVRVSVILIFSFVFQFTIICFLGFSFLNLHTYLMSDPCCTLFHEEQHVVSPYASAIMYVWRHQSA